MNHSLTKQLSLTLGVADIIDLKRLSGGANLETWSFDAVMDGVLRPLILRRLPISDASGTVGEPAVTVGSIDINVECALLPLAKSYDVPVPQVVKMLTPEHELGRGYIMTREPGEALPQRLLTDPRYAEVRKALPRLCGVALARIHRIPTRELPSALMRRDLGQQLSDLQARLDHFGNVSPVHQLGLNRLIDNPPRDRPLTLVHGDFRNGNLLVRETGLSSVLYWELAHIGHPYEDLGYFCANVWRFGQIDKPAGGFGDYQSLLEGYGSVAGHAPTIAELKYWELLAALQWGLVTQTMAEIYESGLDVRLERVAVGRRVSESEIDILLLLENLENNHGA